MKEHQSILEQIRIENGGKLTPEKVVEVAHEETHPLHVCFEWDDSKAGHQYRLWQARSLIRSVKIVIEDKPVPAFVNVKVGEVQYYQNIKVATKNVDEWECALKFAKERLKTAERELKNLVLIAPTANKKKVELASRFTEKAHNVLQQQQA